MRSWRSLLAGVAVSVGMGAAPTAFAGGGGCTPCGDMCAPSCQHCEQIFADAGQRLTDQLASMSCCGTCGDAACGGCGTTQCFTADDLCSSAACGDPGCAESGCGEGCDGGNGKGCGLFGECGDGIEFGGWTQFGYQSGPDGAFSGNGAFNNVNFGPGAGLNNSNEWNNFQLNQQGLYINKTADGSNGIGFGFRAEMIYGVDGNEAQSFGNNPGRYDFNARWNHGIYEWALPQLYAEVAAGDLSVKLGHFYTLIGYEVIPSGGNFFLSRQLTFYNSEPFTHTGALATYTASDELQVMGGWTLGMDTGFDQFAGGSSFLGGFIYTMSEATTFTYMMTVGNLGWRGNGAINSVILTHDWSDKWSSVHQFDVLGSDASTRFGSNFAANGVADNSTGLINYLFYTINDKLKAGVRQEWYKADGISYNTMTYGVNITPVENFVIRPEVRQMWAPGATNGGAQAVGHSSLFNSTVFGVDAILTY
ncbi:MAG: outer membrane beta-barrel protein [Planctomycetaceae bacterium]